MTNTELALPAGFTARSGYTKAFLLLTAEELPYWQNALAPLQARGYKGTLTATVSIAELDYYATVVEFEGSIHAAREVLNAMTELYALINLEG